MTPPPRTEKSVFSNTYFRASEHSSSFSPLRKKTLFSCWHAANIRFFTPSRTLRIVILYIILYYYMLYRYNDIRYKNNVIAVIKYWYVIKTKFCISKEQKKQGRSSSLDAWMYLLLKLTFRSSAGASSQC